MIERGVTVAAVLGLMGVLFGIERLVPLRRRSRPLLRRLVVNFSIAALAFAAAAVFVRPAAVAALGWTADGQFGLLQMLPVAQRTRFVAALLLLDLTFYWWHVANHRVPVLWRFHNVHHIDPDLDVSTAFRFHFGEVALSTAFRVAQVVLIGPTPAMFAVYELLFQANTAFHHSNVRLPIALERLLNIALVTPRMHGIHHSQVRDETNSNYSVVFSWWDRLHRTIGLNIPQDAIAIGVPAYSDPEANAIASDLLLPFKPQRDYWRRPDGTMVERQVGALAEKRSRLAE
jgi:sterol desaturase/sphingolipid hydroxylase (fatty acid hydroxylase superfamily)